MIGRETFEDLDLALKNIKQNLLQFGGVSLLLVGDLLQLPSVNQKSMIQARDHTSHSMDGCGENSNYMNWLKSFDRAVIQILLSYLIEFEKASTKTMI